MKDIGVLGEELTSRWLELQDYDLLQQNWRCRWGEIDIIAQDRDNQAIAFVEVKTRSKNNWDEGGLLAVDAIKQGKMIKTASLFLAKYPLLGELPCRFDLALVGYTKLMPISKNIDAEIDLQNITRLAIGQPIIIEQYQLTIKKYLQSAFEL
ncbi:YraN family protein [Waterburya agarophytonicola K14]|uniref:UPF0102 protein I4641_03215 n=1 Tax=Waterburya agarophytonicola KI4 TaxID=2874699 RepID=A0A964FDT7_9CYAN|nr:YraN family protein [Waterburya agarophytonicola]MCC0175990.1 YraN family protein [Waterburya agarophytonicola KI4]